MGKIISIEQRELLTNEVINYLNNGGSIIYGDETIMINASTTYHYYLRNEYCEIKKIISNKNLNRLQVHRINCYNKIMDTIDNIEIKKRDTLTNEVIEYLKANNGIIRPGLEDKMINADILYSSYISNEKIMNKKLQAKLEKKQPLTKTEKHRLECYNKIINVKDSFRIKEIDIITNEVIEYINKNDGSIKYGDQTKMTNTSTTYHLYLQDAKITVTEYLKKINNGEELTNVQKHRLECYNKIIDANDNIKIKKRILYTHELIEYILRINKAPSIMDQTKMKNRDTTYYSYLHNENKKNKNIIRKLKRNIELTKIEKNELECYNKIIDVIDNIEIKKRDTLTNELIEYLKMNNGIIETKYPVKMFNADITYLKYYENEKYFMSYRLEKRLSNGEKLNNVQINRLKNYYLILKTISHLKEKPLTKDFIIKELILHIHEKRIGYPKYNNELIVDNKNKEYILNNLGLNSQEIVNDMKKYKKNIEDAIKHNYFINNIDTGYEWLEEMFNYLVEIMNNIDEGKVVDIFASKIHDFSYIYRFDSKEVKILLKNVTNYIKFIKEFNIYAIGLEENETEKERKFLEYNLDEYEIEDSYLVSLEFNNQTNNRINLIRQYIIDWNYYTEKEIDEIILKEQFTQEELNIINDTRNKIDNAIKIKKK